MKAPNPICPQIKETCCTQKEIQKLANNFFAGIKKFRFLFNRIVKVMDLYYGKKETIQEILKFYMNTQES